MLGLVGSVSPGILVGLFIALVLAGNAIYIVCGALALRMCGCSKESVAAWAMKQAARNRMLDVISAIRSKGNDSGAPP